MKLRVIAVAALTLACAAGAQGQQQDDWYRPTGSTCSSVDASTSKSVQIESDLYNASTMISADSAR